MSSSTKELPKTIADLGDRAARLARAGAGLSQSILSGWQWRAICWAALLILLGIYAVLSLQPFRWHIPTDVASGAKSMTALVPLRRFMLDDVVDNVVMYLPLGLLLGLMARSRTWWAFAGAVLVVFGVSLAFEFAQVFVAHRVPALNDIICNTIGGVLGLWLGRSLTGILGPTAPENGVSQWVRNALRLDDTSAERATRRIDPGPGRSRR
jgi:hypothetical protein